MPEILIRCPETGKDLTTGISIPAEAFLKAEFSQNRIACPHCGREHAWSKKDAFLKVPPEREISRIGK